MLFDDVDKLFASLPKPYRFALSEADRESDDRGELNDAATNDIRRAAGSWESYRAAFARWAAGGDRISFEEVFATFGDKSVVSNFSVIDYTAPLFFDDDDPSSNWDAASGEARFFVVDPIGDVSEGDEYRISFPDADAGGNVVATREDIAGVLRPLRGKLWRPSEIKALLEIYYARLGLGAIVSVASARDKPKKIEIKESLRVARIVLPDGGEVRRDFDKILYCLLEDADFRRYVRDRQAILSKLIGVPEQPGFVAIDYVQNLGRAPRREPFVNQRKLQVQQLRLADIGYAVSQSFSAARPQPTGVSYVDLFVRRQASTAEAATVDRAQDTIVPAPATGSITEGVVDRDSRKFDNDARSTTTGATGAPTPLLLPPATAAGEKLRRDPAAERRPNFLGGGFEYRPGQGVRFFGLYQRSQFDLLAGDDKFSIKAGGQGAALGEVNYYSDFLFFDRLRRRLSVQFNGSTDFTARRILDGVATDERRTGGTARVELELFRDRRGNLLRMSAEGQRATVALARGDRVIGKQNLTTLDFGGFYFYESSEKRRARVLRVAPQLRAGLGLGAGARAFRKFVIAGEFSQELPQLFELGVGGRYEAASANAPVFERPSLGGGESLRGFRQDDAIGRRLWSLQNELRTPVPGVGAGAGEVKRFLAERVRLAGFVDVGGVYQDVANSRPGSRVGTGVGVRVKYYPLVLGVDWAYGFGATTGGDKGRGRFYFTAKTVLPF